jgi:tetratricopeptide (TPR) repeat protein
MSVQLRIPGQKIDALVGARDEDVEKYFGEFQLVTRDAVHVAADERGKALTVEIPAAEDDVVELEYVDGTREWIAAKSLAERLNDINRDMVGGDTVYVSPQLTGMRTRGAGEWLLNGLKVIGVDPSGQLADMAAAEIAHHFESQQQPGPGLYYAQELFEWDAKATQDPGAGAPKAIKPGKLESSDKPYLVLLHGTASSTKASFGRLARSGDWQSLTQKYGRQILALDHRTLSASPEQNALDLARLLPPKARLHLLSHSRGGLIGELLARGPVLREALEVFKRPNRPEDEIKTILALSEELAKKQFRIERFVRVACPARGTVLASTKLDRYLSILLNLIGLIPIVDDSLIYPFAKATILALIHKKAQPEDLPGLEAMMPTSPLISFLNAAGATSSTDLAVVAGDIEGHGILSTLGVLATDLYFQQDHDLVVNTDSMFKGVERDAGTYYSYEKGPNVSHFNYFINDTSRGRITNWLLGKDPEQAGFKRLEKFVAPVPDLSRELERTVAADAPVVFVVPTAMGTYLRAGSQRIWPNLEPLAEGKLRRLEISQEGSAPGATHEGADQDEDVQNVVTDGIVAEGYAELLKSLADRFVVIPFPYDWRESTVDAGLRLAIEIEAELRRHQRPIHILAHGSGGLVAGAMAAHRTATWAQVTRRKGRLVLLDAPLAGMPSTAALLNGTARISQMLAILDPHLEFEDVGAIFRTFPGVVELLPTACLTGEGREDLEATRKSSEFKAALSSALEVRKKLDWSKLNQGEAPAILQVVCTGGPSSFHGCSDKSPGADDASYPAGSPDGADDATISHSIPTWFTPIASGAVLRDRSGFRAYANLLERGTTDDLTKERHLAKNGLAGISPEEGPVIFPTAAELVDAALGLTPRRGREQRRVGLRISVVHGNLENARFPVVVGHYFGDPIAGAEAVLDRALDGRLSRRFGAGIYPDVPGRAEVVEAPGNQPPGGLVLGLGQVGSLTADTLTKSTAVAAMRHALAVLENAWGERSDKRWRSAAFSSVLVGTSGGYAINIEGSIIAIVQGAIMANRLLQEQGLWKQVRVDEIEFVEMYEDSAIHAAHVISNLTKENLTLPLTATDDGEDMADLDPCPFLGTIGGGLGGKPPSVYKSGWWRRVQISELPHKGNQPAGGLEFISLTDRARAEQSLHATQAPLIERFVQEAIANPMYAPDLHSALYELLLPNSMKDQAQETANWIFVVDDTSANYPWEMIAEPSQDLPLAVRAGVLRQLKTVQFRSGIRTPHGSNALVIGDPDLGEDSEHQLPAAGEEADAVAAELSKYGYSVTLLGKSKGSTAVEIVSALYAKEYRVIHIAAHGLYDPKHPERSGVVIGKDMFLTAAEFGQMRVVPEFVFLNCCHLAKTAPERQSSGTAAPSVETAWHRLAASVARQLIEVGVRAVVAAGWAVNDKAAKEFAVQLYSQMLAEGMPFGDAVRQARKSIFENYRMANTWGAYQCYGMPAFVLSGLAHTKGSNGSVPVSGHEIIELLRTLRVKAEDAPAERRSIRDQVDGLQRALREEWDSGSAWYAFGDVYAALGETKLAIDYLRRALTVPEETETAPLQAIEQLAELEIRYAAELWRGHGTAPAAAAQANGKVQGLFVQALKRLDSALSMGETADRLCLLGYYYQRHALTMESNDTKRKELDCAADNYYKAYRLTMQANDPHSALDWVICKYFASDGTPSDKEIQNMVDAITHSERIMRERPTSKSSFRARVHFSDAALLRALLAGQLAVQMESLAQGYRDVFQVRSTAKERSTALERLECLADLLAWANQKSVAGSLRKLRKTLAAPVR